MDEKPLTKHELMEALNCVIPPLATAIGGLQKDMTEVRQDIGVLKQDVGLLKQDVGLLKQDVSELKQDVGELKQDVSVLKQDVTVIKKELARKPDEDKVRRIVRDELENALTHDMFKLTLVKN